MTTLAARKEWNEIIFGADRRCTSMGEICTDVTKFIHTPQYSVGMCWQYSNITVAIEAISLWKVPKEINSILDVMAFLRGMKQVMVDNGANFKIQEDNENSYFSAQGGFIFVTSSQKIFEYNGDLQIHPCDCVSSGSGSSFAKAVLHVWLSIEKALKVASELDAYTGPVADIWLRSRKQLYKKDGKEWVKVTEVHQFPEKTS